MAQSSRAALAPDTLDLVSVALAPTSPANTPGQSDETLFERLWSFGNLWLAYSQAARGKRTRPDVATFDYDMEGRLLQLRDRLRAQTYRPGGYRRFMFTDPKPRAISAAPFADRVVHHALVNVIEPLYERRFIADSYANRHGRGIHQALDRATQFARRYRYVLRCQITA